MNREAEARPQVVEWLARADRDHLTDDDDAHNAARRWEPEPPAAELHCDHRLVTRLTEITRPIGTPRRAFVDGCPVIQHPNGRPIAAAAGTAWLVVRSGLPAGALAVRPSASGLGSDWVELDPWAPASAFAHATDLLRAHIARAYARAEAGA